MNHYKKILHWENQRRIERLTTFRSLVTTYFGNSRAEWMADERIEQPVASEARVQINRMMDEIHDIILYAGVNPSLRYSPPPAVGGYVQDVDLVQNIFILHRFRIPAKNLLDFVDRALGIYESNSRPSFIRTINPFFYLALLLDFIARIPFALIGRAGFNQKKIEESLLGRLIKGTIYIITALASLLTVLQLLGGLDTFKVAIGGFTGSN